MRFCLGELAVVGDIEQMFHKMKVRETDRDALRFVWREPPDQNISEFQMTTHLFGKTDSPCRANFALKKVQ